MKPTITILAIMLAASSYGQHLKGYAQMDGGWNGYEIPFSVGLTGQIKVFVARINWLENIREDDVFSIQVGICPVYTKPTRVYIWTGQELGAEARSKVSIEIWQQINPGIFVTGGVGKANNRTYGHIGFALQIADIKEKKPKRFY